METNYYDENNCQGKVIVIFLGGRVNETRDFYIKISLLKSN